MYAAVLFIGIQNGQTVQPIVDVERTVFYREKAAGMYSALPYAFSQVYRWLVQIYPSIMVSHIHPIQTQVLIEVPHIFLQTVIYGIIVYSMIGFDWTLEKFFWYLFFMFFTFMYFTFYGMMAVAMTPNSDIAAIVSTAFYAIWNIFAGFLVPRPVSFFFSPPFSLDQITFPLMRSMELKILGLMVAEDSSVVEVVLLGLPRRMDVVRTSGVAVW